MIDYMAERAARKIKCIEKLSVIKDLLINKYPCLNMTSLANAAHKPEMIIVRIVPESYKFYTFNQWIIEKWMLEHSTPEDYFDNLSKEIDAEINRFLEFSDQISNLAEIYRKNIKQENRND